MKKFSIFDIGSGGGYFDHEKNSGYLERIARKSYLPTNKMLLDLVNSMGGKFKVSMSITGVLLEQLEKDYPDVLASFQKLIDTGCVELVTETYYHSLASLYSKEEFVQQVEKQNKVLKRLFSCTPRFFRNTELVYNNEIAKTVGELGYVGILAEGWDKVLGWRSPNFVYKAKGSDVALLLRNYRLSDDIAFRFSNRGWEEWPLTSEKFTHWINQFNFPGGNHTVNLFMDYETFGEHQWADTGIFDFFNAFVRKALEHPENDFVTPSELIGRYSPADEIDFPHLVSWADTERDLSAWLGNKMQQSAIEKIYRLEPEVRRSGDPKVLDDWRKLQTSDHFYYMCTKWFADGDVHKYFNPHESPYESFITFMNIYNDLNMRLEKQNTLQPKVGSAQSRKKSRKAPAASPAKKQKRKIGLRKTKQILS